LSRAAAVAVGLVLSVPVALRGAPSLSGFVVLWAAVSLVVVPVGAWLRKAAGPDRAILLGACLSSLPLALFGGVLKSATHHRPLGGATFAVAACLLLACSIGLALRIRRGANASKSWLNLAFTAASLLSLGGTLALAASAAAWPLLVDALSVAAACAAAGSLKIPAGAKRVSAVAVAAAWLVLLTCGVFLNKDARLLEALRSKAPVSYAALSWLGGGS
jgi:hypothetical protein